MKINADIIGGGNNYTYNTDTGKLTDDYELEAVIREVLDEDYFQLVGLLIKSLTDMYFKRHTNPDEFRKTNELIKLYLQPSLPF